MLFDVKEKPTDEMVHQAISDVCEILFDAGVNRDEIREALVSILMLMSTDDVRIENERARWPNQG